MLRAAGAVSTVGESWQRFDSTVTELQAACSADVLHTFFHGWDQHGGGLCRDVRQQVCRLLKADQIAWQDIHFAAEALQELCWEQLHTGHWMDVAVEWRDAYSLYTVLTVVAMLAGQHSPQHKPGPQQQELLQDTQPRFTAVPAGNAHAAVPMAGAAVAGTIADAPTGGGDVLASSAAAIASAAGQQPRGQESSRAAAAAAAAFTSCSSDVTATQQRLCEGLRQLDMAALMGGPRFRLWVDRLIDVLDSRVQELQANSGSADSTLNPGAKAAKVSSTQGAQRASLPLPFSSKRRAEDREGMPQPGSDEHTQDEGAAAVAAGASVLPFDVGPRQKQHKPAPHQHQHQHEPQAAGAAHSGHHAAPQHGPTGGAAAQVTLPPGSLTNTSAVVHLEHAPSMEHFLVECLLGEGGPKPVVLRGVMDSWPAMTKWQDMDYLCRVAGRRTVPVEVGSHYLEEGWGTRLMTFTDFIAAMTAATPGSSSGHLAAAARTLGHGDTSTAQRTEAAGTQQQQQQQQQREEAQPPAPLLYLAQHQLFEQIPALAADILTPDYCMLGSKGVSSVNAWFGPAGTVTPLHQDPEHNLLAQVVGRKYVRLYDPHHTPRLYPHPSGMHTNTSQVDLHSVDEEQFPGFSQVPYVDVVLEPGDMLYMPPKWWHFVQSLTVSFSVSFWWS